METENSQTITEAKKLSLDAILRSINEDSSVNSLIQSSPVCHKIFDPELRLQFLSQAGVTGLKIENIEDFYGKPFPPASAPKATREIISEHLERATKGETNTIEYSLEVDGNDRWYRSTVSPFFDDAGRLIYITIDSLDVTNTKKFEERNKTLLETSPICLKEIHHNDGSGYTLKFMSSAGQVGLGIKNIEDYYGAPYPLEFYPEEAKKHLTEALDKLVETGEPTQVETEVVDIHGNSVWFLSTFTVQRRNEAGQVVSITGASQNITERLMNEEALAKSKEESEQANRAKSEFLSRMSHELRTPLNAILGFGQLMKMGSTEEIERQKSYLDQILGAGQHLLELVDDVLDLSRIESGNFSITKEHLNASEKVGILISQIQPLAEAKNIQIVNKLGEHDDLFVKADRKAFSQIIINLLNNAVKYNSDAGSITVDCGTFGDDKAWISVSDTGPGIAKENIEKLFEPFNRLGQESGGIKGTGIGLSISKFLAELLGGSLSTECELGKGCCFKFMLPAGRREFVDTDRADSNSDAAKATIQSKCRKVLYIEDH